MQVIEDRRQALARFVARLERRSVLSSDEQEALLSLPAHRQDVRANRDFVRMEEVVHEACLIGDGLTGRFAQAASGDRQIIMLHIAGDMVDLHSVVEPRVTTPLHALTDCVLWKIPHQDLRALATTRPALAHAFWRDGVVDTNIIAQSVISLGRRPARARIAHLLCEMAVRFEGIGAVTDGSFRFPVTQQQIADTLGLTAVHVNRMLRLLREQGLAEMNNGRVRILDRRELEQAADFDPSYLQLERVDFHL